MIYVTRFIALVVVLVLSHTSYAALAGQVSFASKSTCVPSVNNFTNLNEWIPLTTGGTPYSLLPGGGLQLNLQKPWGAVQTAYGVNNALGTGETFNSTWSILYGRITFDLQLAAPAGTVVAAILMGTHSGDEIDIEILPAFPTYFQTNVFKPEYEGDPPLFGVFGAELSLVSSKKKDVFHRHRYTIDWSPDQITWLMDGVKRRVLRRVDTKHGSSAFQHFPNAMSRAQIGIWDASTPAGTAAWAGGPIKWQSVGPTPSMTVFSVQVECPY